MRTLARNELRFLLIFTFAILADSQRKHVRMIEFQVFNCFFEWSADVMLKHEKISEKSIRNPIIPLLIKCFNFPLSHEMQTLNTAIIQYPYDNSKSFFASRGKDSNSDITIVSSCEICSKSTIKTPERRE